MHSIMALARTGPDTSQVAHALWTSCAVPAFLYGIECNSVLAKTVEKLESFQARVGNFILNLPLYSSSTAGLLDAGLTPISQLIAERKLNYQS